MITGDFRSAVHAAAHDPTRIAEVIRLVADASDESAPTMLQYAREALRGTPLSDWSVLATDGTRPRDLWNEIGLALALTLEDHERVARVVWLLWEYRVEGAEWETLRDHAAAALDGAHVGRVDLSDVVVWMTSEGEQEVDTSPNESHYGSPSAFFRGGWAWCVLQVPDCSPCVYDYTFQAWPNDFKPEDESTWAIAVDIDNNESAELDGSSESWPYERDTKPLPTPPATTPEVKS